jgi:hypothetical protein
MAAMVVIDSKRDGNDNHGAETVVSSQDNNPCIGCPRVQQFGSHACDVCRNDK